MQVTMPSLCRSLVLAIALLIPSLASAQGLFSPAIVVNDEIITNYELQQRAQLLRVLRFPGDPATQARNDLINDRLRLQVTKEAGIEITSDDIATGIEEFAGRASLSSEQFLQIVGQNGVAPETVRDFTSVNLAWREYIRERYLRRARPTDAEIDRALGQGGGSGGVRVLLSEIIIPATPQNIQRVEAIAQQVSQITTTGAFAAAARRYSASESRARSGRLNWLPVTNLPPAIRAQVLSLAPGQVSSPIQLPNAIALFQLRDIEETDVPDPAFAAIEYATYLIPGGRTPTALATAENIRNRVDTCDDLYGVALGQPEDVLDIQSLPPDEIPQDIALELSRMDEGEVSTNLNRGGSEALVLLMLCGRTAALNEDASREQVATGLLQSRLAAFSEGLLQQLRADALIIEK